MTRIEFVDKAIISMVGNPDITTNYEGEKLYRHLLTIAEDLSNYLGEVYFDEEP